MAGGSEIPRQGDEGSVLLSGNASGSLVAGDILRIGNGSYTVLEDVTPGNGTAVQIYPSLAEEDAGQSVTVVGDHAANMMFQRNAFGFVTRPLEAARGADSYVTSYNGLSVRVTMDYNIATKKQTLSIDTLYGFKTLYPELAVRVLG